MDEVEVKVLNAADDTYSEYEVVDVQMCAKSTSEK